MSETIVIKDKKKRKLLWVWFFLSWSIVIVCINVKLSKNGDFATIMALFVAFSAIPASFIVPIISASGTDKIKFQKGNMCCQYSKIKSKYCSFFGKVKIPVTEIGIVYLDKFAGLVDVYDYSSEKIASIPCLGIFSSKKYMEDVKNYFTQKGINVYIKEVDKTHKTSQVEPNTGKCTTDNLSSVSEANVENMVNNLSENLQINRDEMSQNVSTSRQRNIVNANNTNPEIKPSIKQNEHKGRKLEL